MKLREFLGEETRKELEILRAQLGEDVDETRGYYIIKQELIELVDKYMEQVKKDYNSRVFRNKVQTRYEIPRKRQEWFKTRFKETIARYCDCLVFSFLVLAKIQEWSEGPKVLARNWQGFTSHKDIYKYATARKIRESRIVYTSTMKYLQKLVVSHWRQLSAIGTSHPASKDKKWLDYIRQVHKLLVDKKLVIKN